MALYDDMDIAYQICDFATREEMEAGIAVGRTVLVFDVNRRFYKRPPDGDRYATGGPIHRCHFHHAEIVNETRQSWVLRGGAKIPKRSLAGIYSNLCADRHGWLRSNGHKVAREFERAAREPANFDLVVEMAGRLGLDLPDKPEAGR